MDLAKQYQLLLNDVLNELKLWKANFDLKEKLKSIKAIRAKLNKELNILYENAVSSQDKKQPELTISEQIQYEANLYINNQRIAVIHQKLNALELQKKIIKTNILLLNNLDTKALQSAIDNYREVINQYSAIESSLQTILNSLTNQANLLLSQGYKNPLAYCRMTLKQN